MFEDSARSQDCELVQRLKRRDTHAMVDLYDRYGKLIYSVILRAVRDEATAEDLTQETLLRIWNRIQTFDEEKGRLEGWLVTVARNRAVDFLRSSRSSPVVFHTSMEDLERGGLFFHREDHATRLSQARSVNTALQDLNEDQRVVIELTHFEGMTQTEIAERLQKPLGTVKGLVRSGLKRLRTAMAMAEGGVQ